MLATEREGNTLRIRYRSYLTGILLLTIPPALVYELGGGLLEGSLDHPIANLPVVIFQFAMSPYEDWHRLAWAGALLITLGVLLLNILARVFLRQGRPNQ